MLQVRARMVESVSIVRTTITAAAPRVGMEKTVAIVSYLNTVQIAHFSVFFLEYQRVKTNKMRFHFNWAFQTSTSALQGIAIMEEHAGT